jgi:hypothetical protein
MNETQSTHRIRLPHGVIVKAPGLLPMMYTLREISEELGVPDSTLRGWLEAGAPHQRDHREHLWIQGNLFAAWVKAQQKPRLHRKLESGEGYCLHCNQIVQLVSPEVRPIKGKLVHYRGKCPQCGHIINRGDRYDRTAELS